jgi:hypothetical protein
MGWLPCLKVCGEQCHDCPCIQALHVYVNCANPRLIFCMQEHTDEIKRKCDGKKSWGFLNIVY